MYSALNSLKENSVNAEIAFFGGSFTAIDREYMLELLDATKDYIDKFKGIRISTRPDYINDEILMLLKKYKVTSIELGAQSMCDDVLNNNKRGHSAQDVIDASKLIKSYGFSLGLQMMTGLYKSDDEKDLITAEKFIEIKPDTVRIYPTIVMKNTDLHRLYEAGEYVNSDLESTVNLCAKLITMFEENDINVIRVGLHHSESLTDNSICGPYHPSFRELCESKIMFNKLYDMLLSEKVKSDITVFVSKTSVSKMIGNKRSNLEKFKELGYNLTIIQDDSLVGRDIVLKY